MHQLISVHVFVGLLLLPLVVLKTASTGYRFGRYYTGHPECGRKGPPHPILRITGPLVAVSTLALFGTGLALLALGRSVGRSYVQWHQVAFFVWIALMAVHVLGHVRETVRLAPADWRPSAAALGTDGHRLAGRQARCSLVVVTLAVGVALGIVSLGWVGTWHHLGHFGRLGG